MKDTNLSYDVVRGYRLKAENKIIILLKKVFLSNFSGKIVDKVFLYKFGISEKR